MPLQPRGHRHGVQNALCEQDHTSLIATLTSQQQQPPSRSNSSLPKAITTVIPVANGFTASRIANQLLPLGYRVRGTTIFSLYAVPDVAKDGALDSVVAGAGGRVIPPNIAATLSIAHSAATTPSIKRFVYTTLYGAAAIPKPGVPYSPSQSPAPVQVPAAWRANLACSAAQTKAEEALWTCRSQRRVRESSKVGVLSNLRQKHVSPEFVAIFAPRFCNVVDIALVHAAALLFPDVESEHLLANAGRFNITGLPAAFRHLQPHRSFSDDLPDLSVDQGSISTGRTTELVKHLRDGQVWTTLRDC
ncbi:Aldehyde reductase 2 [Colletotrichum trifolii]|uniref:Aldehyde reductase 2 n=1 Tax=Colletotrichum trifolii TaxID=5466 RepID=A0A4R8R6K5_COLTR|nr:Aldehyde reductase 2 [Colletotrichum trifolii]